MKYKNIITSLLVSALFLSNCTATDPANSNDAKKKEATEIVSDKPIHLTDATFKQLVFDYEKNKQWKFQGDKPAIVDFYASWCGPCRMVAPILEEISKEYKGKLVVYKVDTDAEQKLSQALGIQSLPTIVLIPMNGQPQVLVGAQPKESFVKVINELLLIK